MNDEQVNTKFRHTKCKSYGVHSSIMEDSKINIILSHMIYAYIFSIGEPSCDGKSDGSYAHPTDCSKYFDCSGNYISHKSCQEEVSRLFDALRYALQGVRKKAERFE